MNKFEEALKDVSYSTDWWEYRCNHAKVVELFTQSNDCEWVQVWERETEHIKFRCVVFYIYKLLYVWTDTVEDGRVESSQLDRPVNDYSATVLYCNVENAPPFAPFLMKGIDNGEFKQVQ